MERPFTRPRAARARASRGARLRHGTARLRHGGARPGSGRKRHGRRRVAHRVRPALARPGTTHVTLRLVEGLPSLRERALFSAVVAAFRGGKEKPGFRLVHYSVQANHLHLVVEADGRMALARGMQGLAIRLAKRINRTLGRRGQVFDHRYHSSPFSRAIEALTALRYVLHNDVKHARQNGARPRTAPIDAFSSALWLVRLHGPRALAEASHPRAPPLGRRDPRAHAWSTREITQLEVAVPRSELLRDDWTYYGALE